MSAPSTLAAMRLPSDSTVADESSALSALSTFVPELRAHAKRDERSKTKTGRERMVNCLLGEKALEHAACRSQMRGMPWSAVPAGPACAQRPAPGGTGVRILHVVTP